tara:strand:- start:5744 stop:5968 length:225 start_codon:yes stop_codon:yes gene_type:complete
MKLYYADETHGLVEFSYKTEPDEAQYWATYKLQKSDIKIVTKMERSDAAEMRTKILQDIFLTEPNTRATKTIAS